LKLGLKIKIIRKFRMLTQKQLGVAMGFDESNAQVRIGQYEADTKIPREDNLTKLARILKVNPLNFTDGKSGTAENIVYVLLWLDEANTGIINLVPFVRIKEDQKNQIKNYPLESSVGYLDRWDEDDNAWPAAYEPTGLYFKHKLVDTFLREWGIRKKELKAGEITKEEYFEWKLNWPSTCDDCGKHEPTYKWRNTGGNGDAKTQT